MVDVLGTLPTTESSLLQLRRSRRLAGLSPSAVTVFDMPEEEAAPRAAPSSPLQYYRVPPTFGGKAGEDADEWLVHYKRVSKSNGWDSTAQLTNVVFSLTDTALVWYENHEDALTTWEIFVEELKACFGDSVAKRSVLSRHCRNGRSYQVRHAPRILKKF